MPSGAKGEVVGLCDVYAGVQVKIGPCEMKCYEIGDDVPIKDGVYVGYKGFFVINKGKLLAVHSQITTKFGEKILPADLLKSRMTSFIEEMREKSK